MDMTQLLGAVKFASNMQPENSPLQLGYGAALLQADKVEEAIERFSAAIENEPGNAMAYVHRATAYAKQDAPEFALKDLDTAVSMEPASNVAYLHRASTLASLGRCDDAIVDFEHALTMPNTFEGKAEDLERLVRQTRLALAVALVESQPDVATEIAEALATKVTEEELFVLFTTFVDQGQTERALSFYFDSDARLKDFKPDNLAYCGNLAASAGYRAEAIAMFTDIKQHFPDHTRTLLELGWAYFLEEDYQAAEEALRDAVRFEPTNAHGYCSLAWVLSSDALAKSKAEDALQLAEKMIGFDGYPEDRKLKVLARCQLRLGKTEAARTTIERAIGVASEDQLPTLEQMLRQAES